MELEVFMLSEISQAQQNELQSKYLAILNIKLLQFYQEGTLK